MTTTIGINTLVSKGYRGACRRRACHRNQTPGSCIGLTLKQCRYLPLRAMILSAKVVILISPMEPI